MAADGHTLSASRAGPEGGSRALVVVQEIFGVNSHMRRVCDRFVAEGYSVIAPALFDRVGSGIELGYDADAMAQGRELRGRSIPAAGRVIVLPAVLLTRSIRSSTGSCRPGRSVACSAPDRTLLPGVVHKIAAPVGHEDEVLTGVFPG